MDDFLHESSGYLLLYPSELNSTCTLPPCGCEDEVKAFPLVPQSVRSVLEEVDQSQLVLEGVRVGRVVVDDALFEGVLLLRDQLRVKLGPPHAPRRFGAGDMAGGVPVQKIVTY